MYGLTSFYSQPGADAGVHSLLDEVDGIFVLSQVLAPFSYLWYDLALQVHSILSIIHS